MFLRVHGLLGYTLCLVTCFISTTMKNNRNKVEGNPKWTNKAPHLHFYDIRNVKHDSIIFNSSNWFGVNGAGPLEMVLWDSGHELLSCNT